jgi:hypothetical protein
MPFVGAYIGCLKSSYTLDSDLLNLDRQQRQEGKEQARNPLATERLRRCALRYPRSAFSSNDDCYVENQVLDSRAPQIDLVALAGSGARSDFERDGPARFGHPVSVT